MACNAYCPDVDGVCRTCHAPGSAHATTSFDPDAWRGVASTLNEIHRLHITPPAAPPPPDDEPDRD